MRICYFGAIKNNVDNMNETMENMAVFPIKQARLKVVFFVSVDVTVGKMLIMGTLFHQVSKFSWFGSTIT
jgi:hypothetical protein